YRDYLAEFLATLVFLVIGLGVNGQYKVSYHAEDAFFAAHFTWGLGIMCGVYVGHRISGSHLNPAVTLALALFREFPKRKILGYWLMQTLGAFVAAAIVFASHNSMLNHFDSGNHQASGEFGTGGIFYVTPKDGVSLGNHFFSEFIGTVMLLVVVCAVIDRRNNGDAGALVPIIFGFTVIALLMALGFSTGFALNPARDLGPRIFALIVYGGDAFSNSNYYFWVPIVAPILGALVGCFLYD
ncbi:aquaporin-like protein, partial [Thamnocephalis sphaerospora]